MISVEEALARLLAPLEALPAEQISVADAVGRVLAEDVAARRTQPPFAVSAMDGYAVRAADVTQVPAKLRIVTEIPAGAGYGGTIGAGEAARIFTGAPLPAGADAIVIQEDTERDGDRVEIREGAPKGRYVRRAGLDFAEGDVLLQAASGCCPSTCRGDDRPRCSFIAGRGSASWPAMDRHAGRSYRAAPDRSSNALALPLSNCLAAASASWQRARPGALRHIAR
jgi:hypothetical protein